MVAGFASSSVGLLGTPGENLLGGPQDEWREDRREHEEYDDLDVKLRLWRYFEHGLGLL